jgi:hypothetical protein
MWEGERSEEWGEWVKSDEGKQKKGDDIGCEKEGITCQTTSD